MTANLRRVDYYTADQFARLSWWQRPLIVTDKITLKLPEHDRIASVFYRGRDGNLTNRDPNQRSIFEVVVDQTTGEVTD